MFSLILPFTILKSVISPIKIVDKYRAFHSGEFSGVLQSDLFKAIQVDFLSKIIACEDQRWNQLHFRVSIFRSDFGAIIL